MSIEIKRNDPCHCDSGKKYKNCHGHIKSKKPYPWVFWGIILVLIVIFSLIPDNKIGRNQKKAIYSPFIPKKVNKTKPEGQSPPGKVWSSEHGHWHDSKEGQSFSSTSPQENKNNIREPEVVPLGKVWSPKHGHWHDEK